MDNLQMAASIENMYTFLEAHEDCAWEECIEETNPFTILCFQVCQNGDVCASLFADCVYNRMDVQNYPWGTRSNELEDVISVLNEFTFHDHDAITLEFMQWLTEKIKTNVTANAFRDMVVVAMCALMNYYDGREPPLNFRTRLFRYFLAQLPPSSKLPMEVYTEMMRKSAHIDFVHCIPQYTNLSEIVATYNTNSPSDV
jgi:hypothetical protein